ncbi:MAG: EAL domain-containing protein [Planctomycetaceae bacterium]
MIDYSTLDATTSSAPRVSTGWFVSGRIEPGQPVMRFPVEGESMTIGRRAGLAISVPSAKVSGRHAELLVVGGHLFIRDLGSTNGTYVNRRRLTRPLRIDDGDHFEIADVEFRVEYQPATRQPVRIDPSLKKTSVSLESLEQDWVLSQFDSLIRQRAITPYYQPIVNMQDGTPFAYEALARSSVSGLENPGKMFDNATLLGREAELSIICRERAIEDAGLLNDGDLIFVNTHPSESLDVDVLPSLKTLRQLYPDVKIVLEIHEAAISDPAVIREFSHELRDIDVDLAYDDFGAGRSRLLELIKAPPKYLKFDVSLIRDLDQAPVHQHRMLHTLIDMSRDFSTTTLAEGIETQAEAEICRELGFDFAQGYYFGRPAPPKTDLDVKTLSQTQVPLRMST